MSIETVIAVSVGVATLFAFIVTFGYRLGEHSTKIRLTGEEVEKHESRLQVVEKSIAQNDVLLATVVADVKEIKSDVKDIKKARG